MKFLVAMPPDMEPSDDTQKKLDDICDTADSITDLLLESPSPDVAGPACIVVLTELAKADGVALDTLLRAVTHQYILATGDAFRMVVDDSQLALPIDGGKDD